jgi:hypothetical protein
VSADLSTTERAALVWIVDFYKLHSAPAMQSEVRAQLGLDALGIRRLVSALAAARLVDRETWRDGRGVSRTFLTPTPDAFVEARR